MTRSCRIRSASRIKASRRRSRTLLSATVTSLVPTLKFDVAERQPRRDEQSWPPQDGPYPGNELLRLERLAEIIVRTAVQPIDHVFLGILGGQHDESWPFRQSIQRHDDVESVT